MASARIEPWSAEYRDLEGVRTQLEAWAASVPDLARLTDLGESRGGRAVPMLEFGAPGSLALEDRATVLLIGGLDGVSISGAEAVMAVASDLLLDVASLPPEVAFVALPWAAPDGLSQWVFGRGADGRNDQSLDDDFDGALDEDSSDDLDGDGRVLDMLLEDPLGPWTRRADPRFLRPAEEGDAPRYRLMREGRDDDGDGLYNEDGPGGVVLDQHFPVGWEGPWDGTPGGLRPLSEPLARRLADLLFARRSMAAIVFQGNHGLLAAPGGQALDALPADRLPYSSDTALYERWSLRFAQVTGRAQSAALSLWEARGAPRPGAAIDWMYASASCLAFELAAWGPEVGFQSPTQPGPGALSADARWAAWLDDEHGGIGFVDWAPVALPNGGRALVGGWAPRTRWNPPISDLEAAVARLSKFVRELAVARPQLDIEIEDPVRTGELCSVRARVRNTGSLPSGISRPGAFGRLGGVLRLELPPGARLVAGAQERALDHLPGGGVTLDFEWLLVVPQGASLALVAEDDWSAPKRVEVRP